MKIRFILLFVLSFCFLCINADRPDESVFVVDNGIKYRCDFYYVGIFLYVVENEDTPYSGEISIKEKILVPFYGNEKDKREYVVMGIHAGAFKNCTRLMSVTIPSGINKLIDNSFYEDYGMYQGNIFEGCTNLESIVVDPNNKKFDSRNNCNALIISSSNTIIAGCKNTILPDGVTVSEHAFDNCIIPSSVSFGLFYYIDEELYKTETYKYHSEITPEAYPTKKGMTFSGWSEIPETMPGKDVEVRGTFSWSKKTEGGVIYQVADADNELAAVIGNDNASGEVKIADAVEFDDGTYKVTKIADNAFDGQNAITGIEIGKNVTAIGERAFANNNKLNDVYCYAEEVPETDRTAFENSYIDYVTLHVPAGSVDKYKAVGPWKDFKNVVAIAATGDERCATPTIKFENGKIKFDCETEGVRFRYQITNADVKSSDGAEVALGGVYSVRVYASKEGFRDSEAATMEIKLPAINGDVNNDGEVNAADHVALSNIIMQIQEQEADVDQEETNE